MLCCVNVVLCCVVLMLCCCQARHASRDIASDTPRGNLSACGEGNSDCSNRRVHHQAKPSDWRYGPAQLWYDMIQVPQHADQCDYGFKLAPHAVRICWSSVSLLQ